MSEFLNLINIDSIPRIRHGQRKMKSSLLVVCGDLDRSER